MKILAINPGSTSTKIGLFQDEVNIFTKNVEHSQIELKNFKKVIDQYSWRKENITAALRESGVELCELSAVVGRGGLLPPVKSGAYLVNDKMVSRLMDESTPEHASNLGALIAKSLADEVGIPAYIYDAVATDEFLDIARISGSPLVKRSSLFHALNSRSTAIACAKSLNREYKDMNFIVAHLGGGMSISAHNFGRVIDIVSDDEGPFSPERTGRLPIMKVIDLCYSGIDKGTMKKNVRGNGGLLAYLGTTDVRAVEAMIENGDEKAKVIYDAMCYQIAKGIGELSVVLRGNIDGIILTGGIAHSKKIVENISGYISFLGKIYVFPGENELQSLASGAYRVLSNLENTKEYCE